MPAFHTRAAPQGLLCAFVLLCLSGCGGSGGSGEGGGEGDDAGNAATLDTPSSGDATASGLRLTQVRTTTADGVESSVNFEWDAQGRLLGQTLRQAGAITETRRYAWPDAVRFTEREDDLGADGSVDRFRSYAYTPDGQLGGFSIEGPDGGVVAQVNFAVDDDGLVESRVLERDGLLQRRETYEYDGGRLGSVLIDSAGTGMADQVLGYAYAEDGSVAGTTLSQLEGGAVLANSAWTYERGDCIRNWMNSVFRNYCVTFL